jgi:hypothetical protein
MGAPQMRVSRCCPTLLLCACSQVPVLAPPPPTPTPVLPTFRPLAGRGLTIEGHEVRADGGWSLKPAANPAGTPNRLLFKSTF